MRRAVTFDADTWERLQRLERATGRAEVSHVHRIVSYFMRSADPELSPAEQQHAFADLVEYRGDVLDTLTERNRG